MNILYMAWSGYDLSGETVEYNVDVQIDTCVSQPVLDSEEYRPIVATSSVYRPSMSIDNPDS